MAEEKKTRAKKEIPKLEIVLDESSENREQKLKYCYFIQRGATKKDACTLIGYARATVYEWMAKDQTFQTGVEASRVYFKQQMVEKIAFGYTGNPLEVLRNRYPNEWNAAKKIAVVDPEEDLKKTLAILRGEEMTEGEVQDVDSEDPDGTGDSEESTGLPE